MAPRRIAGVLACAGPPSLVPCVCEGAVGLSACAALRRKSSEQVSTSVEMRSPSSAMLLRAASRPIALLSVIGQKHHARHH
jgi:hypothetical protein